MTPLFVRQQIKMMLKEINKIIVSIDKNEWGEAKVYTKSIKKRAKVLTDYFNR